jgi:outer membrane murein-binding lipoprotein Lpp
MSEIAAIIDTLESRVQKLIAKIDRLENQIVGLKQELGASEKTAKMYADELAAMKSAYETLKTANALLGSEENKRDTKLKINSLIRDIDHCIAQLAD